MIIAIVICAKSRVRKKGLWIPLIVLLHTGFSLTLSPQGVYFNLWILQLNLTSLQKFIDGTQVYSLLVPLGAILFLCLKKRLEWEAEQHRNMQLYRQNYVPPYTPGEDPPEPLNMQPYPQDGSGAAIEPTDAAEQNKQDGGDQGQ
jgi:hypothetical protein